MIDVNSIMGEINRNIEGVIHKIGLDILNGVVLGTPVDTGRARGGWMVELNNDGADANRVDKSGSATISEGSPKVLSAKLGDNVHISNAVPYIGRLNDGYSKQAPAGFIEAAEDAATKL